MDFAEKAVAVLVAVACIVMLLRLAVGAKRRQRFDRAWRVWWQSTRKHAVRLYRRQTTRKEAEKATQEILQRLRRPVERRGNVISPKAFKRPGERPDGQADRHNDEV